MTWLTIVLKDRRRRQSGSVLSALLIIVAFLSIVVGALLTELTDSLVVSRDLASRVKNEATLSSAAELSINQMQNNVQRGNVPADCAKDNRQPPTVPTLNGSSALVLQKCSGIAPEVTASLANGPFPVDGVYDAARNRYLVGDANGRLWAYPFGATTDTWVFALGGATSGQPLTMVDPDNDGSVDILTPVGKSVVEVNDGSNGRSPARTCSFVASNTVTAQPAVEVSPPGFSPNFPAYTFFGDVGGGLYAYDASIDGVARLGQCANLTSRNLGGRIAGAPMVFTGRTTRSGGATTVSDEVFVIVTDGSTTTFQNWRYTETTTCAGNGNGQDCDGGNRQSQTTRTFGFVTSVPLNGANAIDYATSASAPPLNLVVATAGGRLDLAWITVNSRLQYSIGPGASTTLPSGSVATRAPYWCHCPGGQDLIGVGAASGNSGNLYLYTGGLSLAYQYIATKPINTTPMADSNGEWYFGADDGFVYDVEIPSTTGGVPSLFKAARFGPGGTIQSSPIVADCPAGPCLYFGSSSLGLYFARIGSTRITDLQICLSQNGSPPCAAGPHLWARVQVGPAAIWRANGVYVQGWQFYSP